MDRDLAFKCHATSLFQETAILSFDHTILVRSIILSELSKNTKFFTKCLKFLGDVLTSSIRTYSFNFEVVLLIDHHGELLELRQGFVFPS